MISNPAATSRLIATGINRANNSANSRSGNPSAASNSDLVTPANVGRVAAAAQAFSTTPPPKSTSPPVAPRADSSRLLQQKVSLPVVAVAVVRRLLHRRAYICSSFSALSFHPFSAALFLPRGSVMLKCGCGDRNSAMSTCRPPGRCSAPCAGRPQRRAHRLRPCTPHRRSLGRKLRAVSCRRPCAGSLRRLRMRPSRKRTPSQSRQKKRKWGESGQRRYTIIPARCVDAPPSLSV